MTRVNRMMQDPVPDYVVICYLAGVAVECLLHAYRMRSQVADSAKHDLRIHADISGFYDGMSAGERRIAAEYLNEVVARWQNNHRYRSEEALRRFVEKHRLYVIDRNRTTRVSSIQFNAERLVEAAGQIVTIGVRRWTL